MSSERRRLMLGIDLGTTALKCAVYDDAGNLVAEKSAEYGLLTPRRNWVEVDVETYWTALRDVLAALMKQLGSRAARLVSMAISAQGETLVPVDTAGNALRHAIVWLDNRAETEAAELQQTFGAQMLARTGQPSMLAAWPAAKVLWLTRHEPRVAERTARYLLLEDWLIARLTGEYVSEGSLLTSTCYWDPATKAYWPEMLEAIGASEAQLPDIVEPGALIGTIRRDVAGELGLPPALNVCAGALDQACGAIGAGNIAPGHFSENTGAAVALCATVGGMTYDPAGAMPCHYHGLADRYMLHTFTGGGIVLRWFRDKFCSPEMEKAAREGRDSYALLSDMAAGIPAGADGLLMLPHLQGAMAPENNDEASGVLMGLTLGHDRAHVVRAIMESVGFIVRRNVEAIEGLGTPIPRVRALGGGARSPVWKQIEADILDRPVATMKHGDAGALGAALLGGLGVGVWSDVSEAVSSVVEEDRVFEPNPAHRQIYDDRYGAYLAAYDSMVPVFGCLK